MSTDIQISCQTQFQERIRRLLTFTADSLQPVLLINLSSFVVTNGRVSGEQMSSLAHATSPDQQRGHSSRLGATPVVGRRLRVTSGPSGTSDTPAIGADRRWRPVATGGECSGQSAYLSAAQTDSLSEYWTLAAGYPSQQTAERLSAI